MKYFCIHCSYVYDEAFWDETEGIEAGTKIEDIQVCPSCGEIDSFLFVNEEVNYVDESTTDLKELEHFIEAKKLENWEIFIIISDWEHPMEPEHKIASVSLFDEYGELIEEKFLKEENAHIWEQIFSDYGLDIFEIRVKCNKHWVFARRFENL